MHTIWTNRYLFEIYRFAEFITCGVWHVTDLEHTTHNADHYPVPADVDMEVDSETGSELFFVLGNPSMTVRLWLTKLLWFIYI